MVSQISGNNFNKWFQFNPNSLSFGQQPVRQDSNHVQNPPVDQGTNPVNNNYQFTQPFTKNLGGVTGPTSVDPVQGVARTESVGYVTAEDGSQISMGGQGHGFYKVMAPGAGEDNINGLGRTIRSKWFVG